MKSPIRCLEYIFILGIVLAAFTACSQEVPFKDTVSFLAVREIDGVVWLCTSEGAYRTEGKTYRRVPDQALTIWDIKKAGGALWLISTGGAYQVKDKGAHRIPDKNLHIFGLKEEAGKVWLFSDEDTYCLDGQKVHQFPGSIFYSEAVVKAGGITWIKTNKGMFSLDGPDIDSENLNKIKARNVVPLKQSVWLLAEKGAYEVTGGRIRRHILKDEDVLSIADTPRGVFVGTRKGAYRLEVGKLIPVIACENEDEIPIRKILVSGESVWLLSSYDVYCVDDGGIRKVEDVSWGEVKEMDGSLWLCSTSDVYRIDGSNIKHVLDDASQIYKILNCGSDIWALSMDGAFRIRGNTYTRFLEEERIIDVQMDGELVWIASSHGCYRLKGHDIRRIPDKDIAVSSMVVSDGVTWISTEKGEGFRIQGDQAERLTTLNGIQETENLFGDGPIQMRGSIASVGLNSEDDYSVRFDIEFNLRYVNEGDRPAFIWDPKDNPKDRSGFGGYRVALTKEDALKGKYIYYDAAGVSTLHDPKFRNFRCELDTAKPPGKLIRSLEPGEAWEFTKYNEWISFGKKEGYMIPSNWSWERIKSQKHLWIQLLDNTWHTNLEYSPFGSPFGHMLRRRWQNYGFLQLGYLESEPIPFELPEN